MDRIINETIRTKSGIKKRHITGNKRTALKMVLPCHANVGPQNRTHMGKGGIADQSIWGRMGLWTACKEDT
jgi:hypothetical protein